MILNTLMLLKTVVTTGVPNVKNCMRKELLALTVVKKYKE